MGSEEKYSYVVIQKTATSTEGSERTKVNRGERDTNNAASLSRGGLWTDGPTADASEDSAKDPTPLEVNKWGIANIFRSALLWCIFVCL